MLETVPTENPKSGRRPLSLSLSDDTLLEELRQLHPDNRGKPYDKVALVRDLLWWFRGQTVEVQTNVLRRGVRAQQSHVMETPPSGPPRIVKRTSDNGGKGAK